MLELISGTWLSLAKEHTTYNDIWPKHTAAGTATVILLFVSHVQERNPVERINFEFLKTFRFVMIKLKGHLENAFHQCFPGMAGTVEYIYGVK